MKKLIAILGPTAVGKTAYAIALAKSLGTEIISADSRQIFQELSIGAGRPSHEELLAVKHHFIASISVHEEYSAGRYSREASDILSELFQKNDTVVCCGGSMLYLDAIINGFDDLPTDKTIREHWNQRLIAEGIEVLQQALHERDAEFYNQVDLQNPHRLIRALEVCDVTGKPFSALRLDRRKDRDFEVEKIGLDLPREELYSLIDTRVLKMMESGLLEEVQSLVEHRHLQALNTVGYKELFDYMDGNNSLDFAVQKIQQHTRNFAKRQLTWWRRDAAINWRKPTDRYME